ncbi:MAG: CAP domain-containing protein, partial [Candidatus Paceibacterota bacterium]
MDQKSKRSVSATRKDVADEASLKPHPLQKAAMFGMMALVLISFSLANVHSILWISSEWLVSTILPAVVTDATNKARAAEGQVPLSRNALLDEAARLKAEDMARQGYFAHWSPS